VAATHGRPGRRAGPAGGGGAGRWPWRRTVSGGADPCGTL